MNICSEELKNARISQEISLEDISAATRINVKFLQAIEEGQFSILPQAYVRAFIREYAAQVGMNPDDCIKKYEQPNQPQLTNDTVISVPATKVRLSKQKGASQTTVLAILAIIVVVGLIGSLTFFRDDTEKTVEEIPFQQAVEETEKKPTPDSSISNLSKHSPQGLLPSASVSGDSLLLFISASESAWISLIIDEKVKSEILLLADKSMQWKAAHDFKLTVGNAGGIKIKLNNKEVPSLGKRGAVIRDFVLTRQFLEQTQR
ncbi:MAG: DUF4115 domain-containing protein [Bacteroidota bacterium]|nr:DUF4115 domain-containing protein [Bacteroidota bacterium]